MNFELLIVVASFRDHTRISMRESLEFQEGYGGFDAISESKRWKDYIQNPCFYSVLFAEQNSVLFILLKSYV